MQTQYLDNDELSALSAIDLGIPMDQTVHLDDEEYDAYERLYLRMENEGIWSFFYYTLLRACDLVLTRIHRSPRSG